MSIGSRVASPPVEQPPPPPRSAASRILTPLGLLALAAAAVVGADPSSVRERMVDAVVRPEAPPPPAPSWQDVVMLRGTGTTAASPFLISDGAIQWRVNWTCQSGRLLLEAPGRERPVVDTPCPGTGTGFATGNGPQSLQVSADGPWQLDVEQQMRAQAK